MGIEYAMGLIYQKIIKPLLFKQEPERAHEVAVLALKFISELGPFTRLLENYNQIKLQPIELFGLKFPNHVGIAAGFDKNAECFKAAGALGFGHIESGTITLYRQPGNPKPRLFRFPEEEAIINRMGFNNDGAKIIAERLAKSYLKYRNRTIPLGINIGKSKITPIEEAEEDYVNSFNLLADYADYFTINVSSPNTAGLRELQGKKQLRSLLNCLKIANSDRAKRIGSKEIPMLLKIAPDLTFPQIDSILEIIQDLSFAGIVATNTTLQRPSSFLKIDCAGGLSGRPLHRLSVDIIKYIHLKTAGKLPIIGVGGIMDPESAGRTMDAGASLVQIYTGLVYKGPFLGKEIARSLSWRRRPWI
jgi:dihydroorotate dehydrogenase